jgi:hypothetical protein
MTQEADHDSNLSDWFQNTHHDGMHQSGIFRIGALKKIGKMKICFFPNENFQNQKYYSKNGSKKLRGVKNTTIGVLASENDEFSSLNEFGHHVIDLYPRSP